MTEETEQNELEKLQQELAAAKAKAEEYLNGWKRERADFLNYKKDEISRATDLADYTKRKIILGMLPVIDNIYRAAEHLPAEGEWTKGFLAIEAQAKEFLKREGVEEIKTVGEPFDPSCMEALEEEESENPNGIVLQEAQKGYVMDGKLIRPAKVKISK